MKDNEDLSQALLDMSPSERLEYVSDFIVKSEERLDVILKFLGWTKRCVMKDYNTNSLCTRKWKTYSKRKVSIQAFSLEPADDRGYESSCEESATSTLINEESSLPHSYANGSSLFIPEENLRQIVDDPSVCVPERFSDLQINFSREQKLRLYDYAVAKTSNARKSQFIDFAVVTEDDYETLTRAINDVGAKRKQEKNQQHKYKTSKLTYIEELRQLLHLQMEAFRVHLEAMQQSSAKGKDWTLASCGSKESESVAVNMNTQKKLIENACHSRQYPKRLLQRPCRKIAKGKTGGGDHTDNVSSERTFTRRKGGSRNSIRSKVEAVGRSSEGRNANRRPANLCADSIKGTKLKRHAGVRARS